MTGIGGQRNLVTAILGAILICAAVACARILLPFHGFAALTRAGMFWFGFTAAALAIVVLVVKGTER